MLRILALAAALAAPTVDLPTLFADELERMANSAIRKWSVTT